MRIAPPADDAHLQLLKSRNRSEAAVPVPEKVDPIARPEDLVTEETSRQLERPAVDRRKGGDRRQEDRRQGERQVFLDTRESRERRNRVRRREDREKLAAQEPAEVAGEADETPAPPRRGIDVYA